MIGKGIAQGIIAAMVIISIISGVVGAILFWSIPIFWGLIKPWLHQITG